MARVETQAELAIHGGPKVKTTPFGKGARYGAEELAQLKEALDQGSLFYAHGSKVKTLCERMAAKLGFRYGVAATSGTAAIHTALSAVGVRPGDHVVTSPITDVGSVIGILLQGAVPLFADLHPHTYAFDLDSLANTITDRTRAIMPVHLAGVPSPMDKIMEIARERDCAVVEDCAQAWGAYYQERHVGTFGDAGAFSLNEFKHISCGDGGLVLTDSEEVWTGARLFADKYYDRLGPRPVLPRGSVESEAPTAVKAETKRQRGRPRRMGGGRSPAWLGANYRMTELQGAVALAQLEKLDAITSRRTELGDRLGAGLAGIPGIHPMETPEGGRCSYWFYMLRVDESVLGVSVKQFAEEVAAEGVPAGIGYLESCVYQWDMLAKHQVFPGTEWPLEGIEYGEGLCPTAEAILQDGIRLSVNEFFTDQDVADQIAAVRKVAAYSRQ